MVDFSYVLLFKVLIIAPCIARFMQVFACYVSNYARKEGKIGFINTKGKWIIEPKFDKAKSFSKDLAPVAIGKEWGFINKKGEVVVDFMFNDAEIYAEEGLAPVKKDKEWGFVNISGKLVIPAEYQITAGGFGMFRKEEKGFVNGLARVKKGKKWCFLKTDGSILGNQWFENAELFQK
mgnify:CR=1 FL=1